MYAEIDEMEKILQTFVSKKHEGAADHKNAIQR